MSRQTLVAAFLIACCCYGTTLLAEQRTAEQAAAARHEAETKSQAMEETQTSPEAKGRAAEA